MIRHLYIRIYLTTLASLLAVVVASALLWRFTAEPAAVADHERFMSALLIRAMAQSRPGDEQASVNGLLMPPIAGVALFNADGTLLASAGNLRGVDLAEGHRMGRHPWFMGAIHPIHLLNGRLMLVCMQSHALQDHLTGLVLIALVAFAVAVGTYPVVRRLTHRLEALAASVDQFGSGNLAARATVAGHDEMSQLASSFNRMADRVTGLLDAHRRLLANASHELRSPLTRLRLALDLYEQQPRGPLMADMRRDCAEIDEQIEEILLASKLDTVHTTPPKEAVDLAVLVAEECARLQVSCEVVPAPLRGDAKLLRRLVRNLLDNALKYGGEGVDAQVLLNERSERVLRVCDRGPGIPEAEREKIFEPFYRPGSAPETGSGWGLGLALVRQIADHHGGQVRCLPREGGGCIFELKLPPP